MGRLSRSFHSIAGQLFWLFFLGMIVPVALGGYLSYTHSTKIVQEEVSKVASITATQVSDKMNLLIKSMEDKTMFLMGNPIILEALGEGPKTESPLERYLKKQAAQRVVFSVLSYSTEIMDIYIFDANKQNHIFSSPSSFTDYRKEEWYQSIVEADGTPVWFGLTEHSFLKRDSFGFPVYGLGRAIKDRLSGEIIGVMFVEARGAQLRDELRGVKLGDTGYAFIVDQDNRYVYHQDASRYGTASDFDRSDKPYYSKKNGKTSLVIPRKLNNGWTISALVPIEELDKNSDRIRRLTAMILAGSAIFAVLMGGIATIRIARPLVYLNRLMRKGAAGDLYVRSNFGGKNEIGQLGRAFDRMIEQIGLLFLQIEREEADKKKAEIRAMRYQINPHFLYNTLNSIRHLARFQRIGDVERSITNLIPLLEANIERGGSFVSIGEEIKLLGHYMVIQQYRYSDKAIKLHVECPEELESMMIPRMLLQPIVENAIFHGISPKDGESKIHIRVDRRGSDIFISVEDNGVGIEPEIVPRLLNGPASALNGRARIGLANVNETLKLYFGPDYGLNVESESGKGTTVTLKLKAKTSKEADNGV